MTMTTTAGDMGTPTGTHDAVRNEPRPRAISVSLGMVGLVTIAIAAWGAIIPYLGPTFGYSADGAGSWHWSLTHTVLALVPGAIGFLMGLTFLVPVRATKVGRRKFSLAIAGIVTVACGAWFVIGPLAWPVITDVHRYFVPASPLRNLANQVGYALGPGLVLAACGAFVMGWATRHNRPLDALRGSATDAGSVTEAPMTAEPDDNVQVAPGARTTPMSQGQSATRASWSTRSRDDAGGSVGTDHTREPTGPQFFRQ